MNRQCKEFLIKSLVLFLLSVGPILPSSAADSALKKMGVYSNEESGDGEHSGGYTVWLWRTSSGLKGVFKQHEGLIGDGSSGEISNVLFDAKKNVSFTTEFPCTEGWKASFKGRLIAGKLIGTVVQSSGQANQEKVTLTECCKDAEQFKDYDNVEAWKRDWVPDVQCGESR